MKKIAGAGSRERMVEATIALMRGTGLSGAGINEIVRESGAPKGSVYHFFPNGKRQITAEALNTYSPRVHEFIDQALASKRLARDKVKALFDAFARRVEEGDFRQSCPVGTVSLDLDADSESLRLVLAAALSDWVILIARHFAFSDSSRTKSFAGLVMTAIEGAYIRCRAERTSRPFKEAGMWLGELAERGA